MENNKQQKKLVITTSDGQPFKIPVEGSLGLLALGYKGVIAWRQVRRQYQKIREANKSKEGANQETEIDDFPVAE